MINWGCTVPFVILRGYYTIRATAVRVATAGRAFKGEL